MALGGDAVVLRTRQVSEPARSLDQRPRRFVEVTAASEPLTRTIPPARPDAAAAAKPSVAAPTAAVPTAAAPTNANGDTEPSADPIFDRRLQTIETALLELLQTRSQAIGPDEVADDGASPTPPPDLGWTTDQAARLQAAADRAATIRSMMPATAPIAWPTAEQPTTIAIVGATGIGKTTTIAKLAATCSLFRQASVGVVSIDPRREVADRQLAQLGEVLGVPLLAASTAEQMRAAMQELAACDLVLIDAGGIGPSDFGARDGLADLLGPVRLDQTLLGLPLTASAATWRASLATFAPLNISGVVLTKWDECVQPGLVAALTTLCKLPVVAMTYGCEVPSDFSEPTADELADRVVAATVASRDPVEASVPQARSQAPARQA